MGRRQVSSSSLLPDKAQRINISREACREAVTGMSHLSGKYEKGLGKFPDAGFAAQKEPKCRF